MNAVANIFEDADLHLDILTRFVGHLDTDGPVPAHRPEIGNCWTWTGYTAPDGYGRFSFLGRHRGSHRAIFELIYGPIEDGLVVDHLCHRHQCARPSHLRAVTPKQNGEHRFGPVLTKRRTSTFRGVSWHRGAGKWQAAVRHHGKQIHLGYFTNPEDAAKAAQALRLKLFTHSDRDRAQALAGAAT